MPKTQMLINFVPGEECRIAIVVDGKLEELYQERASAESHVGNIYKGKVLNVEPGIQAAFIEFGQPRNGFLHISDLHPMYFSGADKEETELVGQKTPRRDRPPIQKCLRRGQEILVQVLKEGIGTKGPTLTSYLSIPGRFLVMMPHMERLGVSRKVEDDEARRAMRKILDELNPPEGFGFIVRTAGIGTNKTELKRDLAYLQRLWTSIERRMGRTSVGELFAESDLVVRTIRDVFTSDIEQVIVDHKTAARRARDFLAIANPRSKSPVVLYDDPIPLFHRFDIERQIEHINARTVALPSGGSLVIDSTEALVAIDVNSGKMRDNRDAETTAFKTNMEAADEICRQLRLRDLGGVVVNDLIDMHDLRKRKLVEQKFRDNLKNDRARTRVLPISQFGILEMTRQRMRPSLQKSLYIDCPACQAAGKVKSAESVVLDVTRRLALVMHRQAVARVELTVSPGVAFQLLNKKRAQLVGLEQAHGKPILVLVNDQGPADFVDLKTYDARGSVVDAESLVNLGPYELKPVEDALAGGAGEDGPTDFETLANDLDAAEEQEQAVAVEQEAAAGDAQRARDAQHDSQRAASPEPADAAKGEEPLESAETPVHPERGASPEPRDNLEAPDAETSRDDAEPLAGDTGWGGAAPPPTAPALAGQTPTDAQGLPSGKRRRRRRRGRGGRGGGGANAAGQPPIGPHAAGGPPRPPLPQQRPPLPQSQPRPPLPPQRAPLPAKHVSHGSMPPPSAGPAAGGAVLGPGQPGLPGQPAPTGKRRRRRRGGRGRGGRGGPNAAGQAPNTPSSNPQGPTPGIASPGNQERRNPEPGNRESQNQEPPNPEPRKPIITSGPPPQPPPYRPRIDPRTDPDVSRGYHNPLAPDTHDGFDESDEE